MRKVKRFFLFMLMGFLVGIFFIMLVIEKGTRKSQKYLNSRMEKLMKRL